MSETCTKCGGEKTGAHPRWCLTCRGDARRNAVTDGNAGNAGNASVTPDGPALSKSALLVKQNEELLAEVAALKRQLAEARKGEWDARVRSKEIVPMGEPVASAKSQNANKATMTPHGPRCTCWGCRSARAEAGA